ncbi:hypothetical protein SAMN05444166_5136 [Singulisphaera sp. GP187]|uniref:hypothetical protein n=1 Tax=Singulisphaera sp. GP187 TaxID=1882752 RepID=UPI000927CEB6|nr:hypothetical protein [Singulisphaera sp. GP187]SIO55749.1 hypothetical protein SAMN05444166_5136 [Singulisphaera sp. GP187]
MATFNDFFVQEITENFFSSTAFHGILVEKYFNGQLLDNIRHVGGRFPYMVRRPWLEHPEQAVTAFRTQLENTPNPDPVKLLNVRARSLLQRGGFRSAMIEASAAFDLCLVRKIRGGYSSQGKTDPEIDDILSKNPRYDDRAKKILKEATGSSAADLDPAVWQRFVAHRTRRGKVAHAATEPSESEATGAVEDMIRVTELVDALTT